MDLIQQWSALVLGNSKECSWIDFSVLQWLAEINIGNSSCKKAISTKDFLHWLGLNKDSSAPTSTNYPHRHY